jgi:hypothetical protein
MIPRWWLLVALIGGGSLGSLAVALCVAAGRGAADAGGLWHPEHEHRGDRRVRRQAVHLLATLHSDEARSAIEVAATEPDTAVPPGRRGRDHPPPKMALDQIALESKRLDSVR